MMSAACLTDIRGIDEFTRLKIMHMVELATRQAGISGQISDAGKEIIATAAIESFLRYGGQYDAQQEGEEQMPTRGTPVEERR